MDTKFKAKDYSNMCINGVTLLEKTDKKRRGAYLWKCKCYCSNIFYAEGYRVANGEISSCGCARKIFRENNFKNARKQLEKTFVDGTNLSLIKNNKLRKNNKSGHVGVSRKKNKWVARICIAGKIINLGSFDDLNLAIKARKEAEEKYFKPILDKYKTD